LGVAVYNEDRISLLAHVDPERPTILFRYSKRGE
jgi:hypothetical protein